MLANKATYLLELLVWQRTKDGQKKAPSHRPRLFVPEFMKQDTNSSGEAEAHTVEDIKELLARPRH